MTLESASKLGPFLADSHRPEAGGTTATIFPCMAHILKFLTLYQCIPKYGLGTPEGGLKKLPTHHRKKVDSMFWFKYIWYFKKHYSSLERANQYCWRVPWELWVYKRGPDTVDLGE